MRQKSVFTILFLASVVGHAQSLTYQGIDIVFPATVRQVSDRYTLGFKSPGFYYKVLPDSVVAYLEFVVQTSEFSDRQQPASVFIDRPVTMYLFKLKDKPGLFETEQKLLEAWLGSKLKITIETGGAFAYFSAEKRSKMMPNGGTFRLAEGRTKEGIRVFLREVPRGSPRQQPMLQVLFCKGATDKRVYDRTHAME